MPTIYDKLPLLEKELVKLLHTFVAADGGAFHQWEITIFLPGSNAFIHYMAGVNNSLKEDNYISTMANLRGLIESLAAVLYDGTAKLPELAYKRFLKKGRLPKWDNKEQKWVDLGARESIDYLQKALDPKIKIKDTYDHCCDFLHFSATHMSFLGGFSSRINEKARTLQIQIGSRDNIPVNKQKEIIDLCTELATVLGRCVVLGTEEKNKRKTPKTERSS